MDIEETIAAIASTHEGQGVRGIVRVSGPQTLSCVQEIFSLSSPSEGSLSEGSLSATRSGGFSSRRPRRHRGTLRLEAPIGEVEAAVYWWPTARSYTCQPLAEIHTWGAPPLLHAVLRSLGSAGARLARPGEFTLRAFLAGRLDLAQAEAVLGVIDATSERELRVALDQLAGGLSRPLAELREHLLNLCADLEAGLDFADEDIEFLQTEVLTRELERARELVAATLRQLRERSSGGPLPRVVLRGLANAGKSSLWNCLLGEAHAIVNEQAGTTRDYLARPVTAAGIRFEWIDTAGVEAATTERFLDMHEHAERQARDADLVVLCVDGSQVWNDWERDQIDRVQASGGIVVATKCDLGEPQDTQGVDVCTSAVTGRGKERLLAEIGERLSRAGGEAAVVGSTATRCRQSLTGALSAIERAETLAAGDGGEELVAAELHVALDHLGEVVGVIYTDDILDRVFSRFCIGK